MSELILKPNREKPILNRHPWVFSGAVAEVRGEPQPGETIAIHSSKGDFLAWGAYSPASQIRARVWDWQSEREIDIRFFRDRLQSAWNLREALIDQTQTNAYRIIHAESDGLPGVILDRYGEYLVLQCLTTGADRWRSTLVDLIPEVTGLESIFERSDADVRSLENLPPLNQSRLGDPPPETVMIFENGLRFAVDIKSGQKTGFFLDQRNNRARARKLAAGKKILNCFAYTGGFTIAALAGEGQHVLSIDSSERALTLGRQNVAHNQQPADRTEWLVEDVFVALRKLRDQNRKFDMVILDPPKFAPTRAQRHRASRGYKDINLLAFKLLNPGGILMTFSCSGGIDPPLFQKIVADAALDAGVEPQILERLGPGPDHPVGLHFPEGAYLKGLVCRI